MYARCVPNAGGLKSVLVGAVLLIALEACGSSAPVTPGATAALLSSQQATATTTVVPPTPAPTSSPTPSPTLSQDQIRTAAAKAYLAAAAIVNKANDSSYKKYKSKLNTLAGNRAYYKLSATITGTFLKSVRAIVFPTDSAADGHSLIVKNSTLQADELDASVDRTVAAMNTDIKHVNSADDAASAAANLIRGDLGLPPIPVN